VSLTIAFQLYNNSKHIIYDKTIREKYENDKRNKYLLKKITYNTIYIYIYTIYLYIIYYKIFV